MKTPNLLFQKNGRVSLWIFPGPADRVWSQPRIKGKTIVEEDSCPVWKLKIKAMNFPGDKSHGARTAWPRLWETWSHWICCEGWQEGNDQKDSESEGQLVQMSTDSLSYLAIQVTEKDIWIVTYPRSGTTWTQEMVGFLCLGLKHSSFHPDLADSQWFGLWGREQDRHWQEVLLPWHGLAGLQGLDWKHHRLWARFG